jgi:uncharacterized repeat protein (TIGR03847 family)
VSGLVHRFDPPTRCVVGTVGQPGERTFFLQVQDADRIISVILEKDQVRILAERIQDILDQVAPDVVAPSPIDDAPLAQPILTDFRIGILGLAWDDVENRIVIEAGSRVVELEEIGDLPELEIEDEDANNEMLDIRLTVELARGFVERSLRVVKAGRPPCPFCGNLLDPTGHICPRANGYRR